MWLPYSELLSIKAVQIFLNKPTWAWGKFIKCNACVSDDGLCRIVKASLVFRDAVVINVVSFCTSLYAGLAVFSIIGYMAHEYRVPIQDVIKSGESVVDIDPWLQNGLSFLYYLTCCFSICLTCSGRIYLCSVKKCSATFQCEEMCRKGLWFACVIDVSDNR